jgi:acetyl esterase
MCTWFMKQLFDDLETGLKHPLAMALEANDHKNLPAATIINAFHDPLRDHGALYAAKLKQAGVPVNRSVYSKSLHGFFGSSLGESNEAVAEAASALRSAFKL